MPSQLDINMKTLKSFVSALLMVAFLGAIAGCDKASSAGKADKNGHGHSHE